MMWKSLLGGALLFALGGATACIVAGGFKPSAQAGGAASAAALGSGLPISAAPSSGRIEPNGERGGRIIVALTADERVHISSEMLAFLQGTQSIAEASIAGDRESIHSVAEGLRRGARNAVGQSIRAKAPEGFTQISQMLRQDFGTIADMAMTAPMPEVQQTLTDATLKCLACHGTYGVVEVAR